MEAETNPHDPIRLLIADDDQIILDALTASFEPIRDIDVVAVALSGLEALEALTRTEVDMALIDVEMPGLDGVETSRRVLARHPDITVVIYTNFEHEGSFDRALQAGAHGFLTKDMPFDALVRGLRRAWHGEPVMGARPTAILLDFYSQHAVQEDRELALTLKTLPRYLTDVLDELIQGHRNKQIATNLHLADNTVKSYVSELLAATGFQNRSELAARAVRCGYHRKRRAT